MAEENCCKKLTAAHAHGNARSQDLVSEKPKRTLRPLLATQQAGSNRIGPLQSLC
jgi:hypothetical protein